MSESSNHSHLVNSIISWINSTQRDEPYIIFSDTYTQNIRNIPPAINGYIPDIYAVSAKNNMFIVGEAKTYSDVETRHSCEQYKAFLNYCANQSNSFFVLAVPWTMLNAAKGLIKYLKILTGTQKAKVIFLDDLPE